MGETGLNRRIALLALCTTLCTMANSAGGAAAAARRCGGNNLIVKDDLGRGWLSLGPTYSLFGVTIGTSDHNSIALKNGNYELGVDVPSAVGEAHIVVNSYKFPFEIRACVKTIVSCHNNFWKWSNNFECSVSYESAR
jgi:hypothetical protein